MRPIFIFLLGFLAGCTSIGPSSDAGAAPRLGERFSSIAKYGPHLIIASSQMSPFATVQRGGIDFRVAVDDAKRAIYVSTDSPAFKSPEGLSIESTLADVLAAGGSPVVEEVGWGFYSVLPSGWHAGFFDARMDGDAFLGFKAPEATSHVSSFFQRE